MEGNSLKAFENLCKIFEMRIKLDREKNIDTPEDVLINYEKYSKKIDSIYNNEFEKDIRSLITPAFTLEKEEDRLKKLIKLLEERLEKRSSLENKFYLATGKYIKGLQLVVSEAELNEKKDRLELITRYLETKSEIESIMESVAKLKNSLSTLEDKKEEYNSKNKIMEDELYSCFIDILKDDDYYSDVSEDSIDQRLVSVLDKVKETKETLDVTRESVESLIDSGASDDYSSYVEDAEKSYYVWKNREIILKIYELVIKLNDNFSEVEEKREKISNLLKERKKTQSILNINTPNELSSFIKLLEEQLNTLDNEREVLENISNYTSRIKFKEDRLDELERENNSVEILTILREYGLIDTYDSEEVTSEIDDALNLEEIELKEDSVIKEVIDPYRIVEVRDYPKTLNIGLAKLKGESVRDKVNKKLNPKIIEKSFNDISSSDNVSPINESPVVEPIFEVENNLEVKDNLIEGNNIVEENKLEVENNTQNEPQIEEITPVVYEENANALPELDNSAAVSNEPSTLPTWEIPTTPIVNEVKLEGNNNNSDNNNNSIPVWYEISPMVEDKEEKKVEEETIPINVFDKQDTSTNDIPSVPSFEMAKDFSNQREDNSNSNSINSNNAFWVPVSDSKLNTNEFPNINIPMQNGFTNGNDNFGFPSIDNN